MRWKRLSNVEAGLIVSPLDDVSRERLMEACRTMAGQRERDPTHPEHEQYRREIYDRQMRVFAPRDRR